MPTLRSPALLAAEAGARDPVDELLAVRLHQAVLSAVTVFPEKTALVCAVLKSLLRDLAEAPTRRPRRPRATPGVAP